MRVPLPFFVDRFLLTVGSPRVEAVKDFKGAKQDSRSDFYRPLREVLVEMHEHGKPVSVLDDFLSQIQNERHRRFYPAEVAGYRRFLSAPGGPFTWFTPPRTELPLGGLSLVVEPHLGLEIGGVRHVIHLDFGQRPTSARRRQHLLYGLCVALRPVEPKALFALLDVPNARLHTLRAPMSPRASVLFRGEAACFEAIHAAL
jgi:hypothetical protein